MPFRYQSCVDFLSLTFVKKKAASIGERRLANALERKGWLNDPHDKKDEPYWAYPNDFYFCFWFCE
ncbi:hypothetical protein LFZ43_23625 [Salmonella enterica subsp. enterica serovar Wandsworth str. SA20092095]|uniref:Uncharacterized protein n=1 Tax=Salmonella enterica subsp. enterica serovar Wandsworth TaxID=913085 RepID=A0A5V9GGL2_SALET|nr:hypothetical protein LFZ43_23625 [Salmonella enterica subsp. enterica serovar Wandsworth str. SA20092095]EAA4211422.1 hypothetical protein [Salmonella enterica subsp. enterica serovar Adelaide]EAA4748744.1 hypothetical protein [Salmonella enterica subsp. enterica serovar Wandsworth]EAA9123379.1 hypothetical protein [Salmonella enterica subsp. enterica serovar Maastricht]EAR9582713.1 hypothetical protein [Salmonella enterica]EBS6312810.1 hypothetical protein [Salmonella enterica subsp. enter